MCDWRSEWGKTDEGLSFLKQRPFKNTGFYVSEACAAKYDTHRVATERSKCGSSRLRRTRNVKDMLHFGYVTEKNKCKNI